MKAKITAEIEGILPMAVKAETVMNFSEDSNVFGRIYESKHYFMDKYKVGWYQVKLVKCEYLEEKK